jgi:thymidylate synthase (FAD)
MAHCVAPEAEKILDREYPVLNHGFVRLVDYLGNDDRIVQAARVSYGEGTKSVSEDAALIDYLLRNGHSSPFEQVIITYHVKLPIFVARQWVRHRTARLNEVSGRYSVMRDEFYLPEPADVAPQSSNNKQGRATEHFPESEAMEIIKELEQGQRAAYQEYQKLLDKNLAREVARINLPLSLYTEWYWQIDLHNLFHFLKLRLDPHAQKEIRLYAEVMLQIAGTIAPQACAAFHKHELGGVNFSQSELAALKNVIAGKPSGLAGKEAERFEAKLK